MERNSIIIEKPTWEYITELTEKVVEIKDVKIELTDVCKLEMVNRSYNRLLMIGISSERLVSGLIKTPVHHQQYDFRLTFLDHDKYHIEIVLHSNPNISIFNYEIKLKENTSLHLWVDNKRLRLMQEDEGKDDK